MSTPVRALLDTNVLVRHFTGDPPAQAQRATAFLANAEELILPDLIIAELIYVLETVYEVDRSVAATVARATLTFPSVTVADADLLHRAVEVHETTRVDFAEAYLAACAEATSVGAIASFARSLDRVPTVRRIEP